MGSYTVSFTFGEDRSNVEYSLLPDRKTMIAVFESILDNDKRHIHRKIIILEFSKLLIMKEVYRMKVMFGEVFL
ncbi:MAG: hypothetical protein ACXW2E_02635 [Nitrososphaeraceae archaeon]